MVLYNIGGIKIAMENKKKTVLLLVTYIPADVSDFHCTLLW